MKRLLASAVFCGVMIFGIRPGRRHVPGPDDDRRWPGIRRRNADRILGGKGERILPQVGVRREVRALPRRYANHPGADRRQHSADARGPAGSLAAAAGGVDIVELVIPGPAMPYLFVSRGTVKTPQDLRDKRTGVYGPGLATSRVAVLIALKSFGLDPRRTLPSCRWAPRWSASQR